MNFYVQKNFGPNIALDTRYSPEYGIGVYRNVSNLMVENLNII